MFNFIQLVPSIGHRSSGVEQQFRKLQVSGSIPLGGSNVCIELQPNQGVYTNPAETGLTSADLIELVCTLGKPLIFTWLAYCFIRYQFNQNAVERVEYNEAMRMFYEAVAQEYHGHWAFSKPTWQRAEMKSRGGYREPTDIWEVSLPDQLQISPKLSMEISSAR